MLNKPLPFGGYKCIHRQLKCEMCPDSETMDHIVNDGYHSWD